MNKISLLLVLVSFSSILLGQEEKQKDKAAIKSMCGCYEVKFNFAEVYSPDLGYDLAKPYASQATELITLVEEDDNTVSMQHILQVSEEMIVKHWRQDWQYEDNELMQYNMASSWKVKEVENAEGTWTQTVSQVDDSPRYEGIGAWTHTAEGSYWEGVSDAPLPRRDLKSRDDYNVLNRRNRHSITEYGHLHEEDNTKINRSKKYGDEVVAIEKGYNTYTKVDDSRCAVAQAWWDNNGKFWEIVREEWANVTDGRKELRLDFEEGKNAKFYMSMFGLGEEHVSVEKFNAKKARKAVRELLASYLLNETDQVEK